jgi:hypothetical protein
MRTEGVRRPAVLGVACALAALLAACETISVREHDPEAGLNGGFETVRGELPVNWYFYSDPLRDGSAEVALDTTDPIEGRRALRLTVRGARNEGRVRTPGLFQVVPAQRASSYRVSFWSRTEGAPIRLVLRSERPEAASPPMTFDLPPGDGDEHPWRRHEFVYVVPDGYENIRVEIRVSGPGTIWLDDLRIEPT